MYKLIFAPEFLKDIDAAFEYISCSLDSPQAAKALMKEIDDSIMRLKDMPYMYPKCDEPLKSLGYRKLVVKNYVIIYEVGEQEKCAYLLRMFYGRRDYIRFFEQK